MPPRWASAIGSFTRIGLRPTSCTERRSLTVTLVRVRRALTPEELQKLLDTTRSRSIKEFSIIRRGKRKGQAVAKLRDEVRERLAMLGRERALIYKMAIYTGLRRGEIAAPRVAHLSLDGKPFPFLVLPGQFTKNRNDAKLLLVPSYAEELRAWIRDARKETATSCSLCATRW